MRHDPRAVVDIRRRWRGCAIWGTALALAAGAMAPPSAIAREEHSYYGAVSAEYSWGNFGTSTNSKLYSLIPEVGYVGKTYDWSVSIPLQRLHLSDTSSLSETGVGDAVLRGGRYLWRDQEKNLSLHGALAIKLATGSEAKGLGTGATDLSGFLSLRRQAGAYMWTVLAGYTQVGEPSGVKYDNVVSYGVGANRSFTRTNLFASLNGQTSAIPGVESPLELDLGLFRLLSNNHVIVAHGFAGLSDGSPDGGIGLSWVTWF